MGWIYCKCLEDVEIRIYPDHFCTSCQISSMNKKARSKIPLKPKSPFKWVFMDIIPSTAPENLTSDTTFSNYLLIFDAYSKIPKLYGMEKITTEEVMNKLDMFQSRFGEMDQFVHNFFCCDFLPTIIFLNL